MGVQKSCQRLAAAGGVRRPRPDLDRGGAAFLGFRPRLTVSRGRIDRYDSLLAGRPDVTITAKKALLEAQAGHLNARQGHLLDQIANLAARWAVEQALAAHCHTIALEDLKTLEHRGLGKKQGREVSGQLASV